MWVADTLQPAREGSAPEVRELFTETLREWSMASEPDEEDEPEDELNERLDRIVNFLATYLP